MNGKNITISTQTIIKVLALTILAWGLVLFAINVSYQLQLIFLAVFVAIALNPAVSKIAGLFKNRNRILATAIAYVVVLGGVIGFLIYVITPLIGQTVSFLRDMPASIEEVRVQNSAAWQLIERYDMESGIEEVGSAISSRVDAFARQAVGLVARVGQTVASILAVLVLAFMMLVEGPRWLNKFYELQPKDKRQKRKKVAMRMYRVITGYVNGQVLISAIGALVYLIAMIIGAQWANVDINAFGLAGIVFLFGLIPLIGNTLGALVVILVAAFASLPLAIGLVIFAIIYQQIENITIQPHIQSKANQLTPLIVFASALIGAGLAGLIGAFAAIPAAGCLKVLVEEYYLNNRLPETKRATK